MRSQYSTVNRFTRQTRTVKVNQPPLFAANLDRFDLEAEKEAAAIRDRNKLTPRRTRRYENAV